MAIAAPSSLLSLPLRTSPHPNPNPCPRTLAPKPSFPRRKTLMVRCAKRTGKQRYPSEKRQLRRANETLLRTDITDRGEGFWRLSKLGVPARKDPGKDFVGVSLPCSRPSPKSSSSRLLLCYLKKPFLLSGSVESEVYSIFSLLLVQVLKEPEFVYTVDMDVKKLLNLEPRMWDFISQLEPKLGLLEYMPDEKVTADLISVLHNSTMVHKAKVGKFDDSTDNGFYKPQQPKKPKVAVVGSGPSGLFASLVLGELGAEVTLIERGQAVEQRGRDIGALVVRRILHSESNFCFGEGGAGTWSDGKLVTRIGRNSDSVQAVMKTLVHFGAPPKILVDGKPHLGTDRLVPLLRNFRQHLKELGVVIKFGTRLDDLIVENRQVLGVVVSDTRDEPGSDNKKLSYDAVVLAVGHSARDVYRMLLKHEADMVPKDFAVGLRIEHSQQLINSIQYSTLAAEIHEGRGRIPVADYKVVKYVSEENNDSSSESGDLSRSCYSFCMCPGGQVVLTSTNPSEICVNGMSFSRRASKWANSALVVTVSSSDFGPFQHHGSLAGVEFQVDSFLVRFKSDPFRLISDRIHFSSSSSRIHYDLVQTGSGSVQLESDLLRFRLDPLWLRLNPLWLGSAQIRFASVRVESFMVLIGLD
uniref:Uncharacterized protein n=1 Tax=Ananas comosus var. bracteatus TaxID=296719 RepID=A0A6V7PE32_ANACO|nr:unnamed protein product [Ananas comosus var. bracteatus]